MSAPNQDTTTPDAQARARLRESAERHIAEQGPESPATDILALLDRLDAAEKVVEVALGMDLKCDAFDSLSCAEWDTDDEMCEACQLSAALATLPTHEEGG